MLPAADESIWSLWIRLALVLGSVLLALRVLKASTALSFGLASLVALLVFGSPLGLYVERLFGQASDLTVFMIVLFGAVLALLSRQDLLERLAARPDDDALGREAAALCLLRRLSDRVQQGRPSHLKRGLLLLFLTLVNFVSSVPAVLLFRSLWGRSRTGLVSDPVGRAQAAGILCLCTTGVLVLTTPSISSTWWIFFNGMAGDDWRPTWPLGVWFYAVASFAHGYWLLTRGGWPAPTKVKAAWLEPQRTYRTLLATALAAAALCFGYLAFQPAPAHGDQTPTAAQVQAAPAASTGCRDAAQPSQEQAAKPDRCKAPDPKRLGVCTLLIGLAIVLLVAQGATYAIALRPAEESWGPAGFWGLMLNGMLGVFSTVVLLVVILAFKDLLLALVPHTEIQVPAAVTPLLGLAVLAGTWSLGMLLGSSWGAFALGFLALTMLQIPASPAWTQALILVATYCNQRSASADNVLNLLRPEAPSAQELRSVWSTPSFNLRITGRQIAIQAQWVQWALLALGILVAWVQAVG